MSLNDNVQATPGSGVPFRTLSDGTNEHCASVVEYVAGGSSDNWSLQSVGLTTGLPVQPQTSSIWGINVAQYLGATVGATNPIHVQPGTGATFPVSGTVTANAGTGNYNVVDAASDPAFIAPGTTTAPTKGVAILGKTADVTPVYDVIPLIRGGTAVSVGAYQGNGALTVDILSISGGQLVVGQEMMDASIPVVLPSDQSPIPVSQRTDALVNGTAAISPQFAKISCAASGDNTLVGAVSGKRIRVLSLFLVANANVSLYFRENTSGNAISGDATNPIPVTAQGAGFALQLNQLGHFQSAVGDPLVLNLSGAVGVSGHLTYVTI